MGNSNERMCSWGGDDPTPEESKPHYQQKHQIPPETRSPSPSDSTNKRVKSRTLALNVSCSQLFHAEATGGRCNPFVAAFYRDFSSQPFKFQSRTEVVRSNNFPTFSTPIQVNDVETVGMNAVVPEIRLAIFECSDPNSQQPPMLETKLIGLLVLPLQQLVNAMKTHANVTGPLLDAKGVPTRGTITVRAQWGESRASDMERMIDDQFRRQQSGNLVDSFGKFLGDMADTVGGAVKTAGNAVVSAGTTVTDAVGLTDSDQTNPGASSSIAYKFPFASKINLQLAFAANKLKKSGFFTKPTAFVMVSIQHSQNGNWDTVGKTEVIKGNLNPIFASKVHIRNLDLSRITSSFPVLRISAHASVDGGRAEFQATPPNKNLGQISFPLEQLVLSAKNNPNTMVSYNLKDLKSKGTKSFVNVTPTIV